MGFLLVEIRAKQIGTPGTTPSADWSLPRLQGLRYLLALLPFSVLLLLPASPAERPARRAPLPLSSASLCQLFRPSCS